MAIWDKLKRTFFARPAPPTDAVGYFVYRVTTDTGYRLAREHVDLECTDRRGNTHRFPF